MNHSMSPAYVRYSRLRKVCIATLDSKTGVWK